MVKFRLPIQKILGSSYHKYILTSSSYTPKISETITISCEVKNVFGTPVKDKTLKLIMNGTSQGTATTNAYGIASWQITFGVWGNKHFWIENTDTVLDMRVDGWKLVETKESSKVKVYRNESLVAVTVQDTFSLNANNERIIATISTQYAPTDTLTTTFHPTMPNRQITIEGNGNIRAYNPTTGTSGIARVYVTYPLKAQMI